MSRLFVGAFLALLGAAHAQQPTAATTVDPGARLLDGDSAGEAWDASVTLEDGSRFLVRFWVTNEGPGSHTGIAMGYFVRPDGRLAQFQYGRQRDGWQSGGDRRFLKIASAVLDLRPPSGSIEIDSNKAGMKIYLRFAIPELPQPLCARRDTSGGFDVLRLQEPVEGIAWVDGMAAPTAARGFIDITHAWGSASEIDTVLRRIDVSGRDGDLAFFATSIVAPTEGARPYSCVVATVDGEPVLESRDAVAEVAATPLAGAAGKFPVPSRLTFRDQRMTLTVTPRRELLRVDPLDIVPQPFRTLLSLRSSPQRAWAEASWQLRIAGSENRDDVDRSAPGLAAVSYTNPP